MKDLAIRDGIKGQHIWATLKRLISEMSSIKATAIPVQWVNRPNAEFRGFSGSVVSGRCCGDQIKVSFCDSLGRAGVLFDEELESVKPSR